MDPAYHIAIQERRFYLLSADPGIYERQHNYDNPLDTLLVLGASPTDKLAGDVLAAFLGEELPPRRTVELLEELSPEDQAAFHFAAATHVRGWHASRRRRELRDAWRIPALSLIHEHENEVLKAGVFVAELVVETRTDSFDWPEQLCRFSGKLMDRELGRPHEALDAIEAECADAAPEEALLASRAVVVARARNN